MPTEVKCETREIEDAKTGLFVKDPKHPAYQDALRVALNHAHKGSAPDDYYQARYQRNGWDIFHFGFTNHRTDSPEKMIKTGYAEIVVNGAHGYTRVYFNHKDSFDILKAVREKGGNLQYFFKTLRKERLAADRKTQDHGAKIVCPF